MSPLGRYDLVTRYIRDAEDLARSGALSLNDGAAAIYFLWGQPSHAYIRRDGELIEGDAALKEIAFLLNAPGPVKWKGKDVLQNETLHCTSEDLVRILDSLSVAGSVSPEPESRPRVPAAPAWDGVA